MVYCKQMVVLNLAIYLKRRNVSLDLLSKELTTIF